jgi:putative endonuclease
VIGSNPIFSTKKVLVNPGPFLFRMLFVYILYSASIDRYYVGHSENVEQRLVFHLSGESPYTSRASDWKLVYCEEYSNKKEAVKRELAIKRKKSRKYIEWLISQKKED